VPSDQDNIDFDFKEDPAVCPYPHYARMRDESPVAQVRKASGLTPFLVTRYEDAKAALGDARLAKDPRVGRRALEEAGIARFFIGSGAVEGNNMLTADPPDHTRLRRLLSAEFTPRRIAALRPLIVTYAEHLVDDFAGTGRAELMAAFANQLPALVIAGLLGVPAADRDEFRTWVQESLLPYGHPQRDESLIALNWYLAAMIGRKHAEPGEDLLGALLSGSAEGRLNEDEVLGSAVLLLIAGLETTVNLIGNGTLALLEHPDQLEMVRSRPDLIPDAIEEFLRYDGPVERATLRFPTEDVEIAGTLIPRGSPVYVVLGSADRDGAAFPDPDRLDVTRRPRGHLAFGHGIHFCLGASLARMEARIAFETLLRRLPGLALAVPAEQLTYRSSTLMRGLVSLPVTFTVPGH
jgi:cytochrome P450